MARRPARCYRYCKNKVSRIFFIFFIFFCPSSCKEGHISLTPHPYSRTRNPGLTVVYRTLRSGSTIWAARRPARMTSPCVCIWCRMNTNSFLPKPLKQPVSVRTSTFSCCHQLTTEPNTDCCCLDTSSR